MKKAIHILSVMGALALISGIALAQEGKSAEPPAAMKPTPADGHEIHVLAPHVVDGKVTEPFHHYCKAVAPDPIIECLLYETDEPNANLVAIEYIVAKTLTRKTDIVPVSVWKKIWHDHEQEIATGRVQVLDMPPDKAKEVADLVAKTDGIVFVLWPHGARLPSGKVSLAQSVAHMHDKSDESQK